LIEIKAPLADLRTMDQNREAAMEDNLSDRAVAGGDAAFDSANRCWEPWLAMWRANALMMVEPWDNVMRAFAERAQLLPRRLAALELDRDRLARGKPLTFRDLVERCTTCERPEQCAWDLREDPANPEWQAYCPNAASLMELANEPSFQRTAMK
jgi:hypothetical protein